MMMEDKVPEKFNPKGPVPEDKVSESDEPGHVREHSDSMSRIQREWN